ncbi:MAG: hypothetical protein D4R73_08335 [Deltaproteobacteria bacterium]|nr:MAG: hypothetical protein D4R73_08335 [Deltaproteobacteria bacterium]
MKKGEVFLLPFPKGGTAAPPLEKGDLGGFYIQADPDFDGALLNTSRTWPVFTAKAQRAQRRI